MADSGCVLGVGIRQGRMRPISTGHRISTLVPTRATTVSGSMDWLMLLHTSPQPFCKNTVLKNSAELIYVPFQRLLAVTSTEPSHWAAWDDILCGNLLLAICYRLCVYAVMATAIRLSPSARDWNGDKGIHHSGLCGRKLSCIH